VSSRYLVGIDLGTTHTVVAYADTANGSAAPPIRLFEIEQLVAPGEVASRPLLPSLRYHPASGELTPSDIALPWAASGLEQRLPTGVVGELARELGSRVPGRLVASAKSWLSHPSVDRTAAILPWGEAEEVAKISPVEASASYLAQVRSAWNQRFPEHPLEAQALVLTAPASFDEVARTLTAEAARLAGLPEFRLLEEPQAACYAWLAAHRGELHASMGDARLLLVCDVGGGTTDLTLIKIEQDGAAPKLTRIGVGDHLMLGGDNMDLALAHVAEARIVAQGPRLGAAGLSQLIQQCRYAKERLLTPDGPERASVTILGSGAKLVGRARSTELTRDEVQAMLLDGFVPETEIDAEPQRIRSGIVEFGLPYVPDPAFTRHIALFLARHAQASHSALGEHALAEAEVPVPDAVLLNGGVFHSRAITDRLLETLARWRGAPLVRLSNPQPDLAVARGAVAYGLARRGELLQIGGGSPRSYFLLTGRDADEDRHGVCLLPKGTQEGQEIRLRDRTFSLRLRQPVRFHLVSSTGDALHTPGELIDIDDRTFRLLPPIATVLEDQAGEVGVGEVPVQLAVTLTEVGTLELSCVSTRSPHRRWELAFQLRASGREPVISLAPEELHPRFAEAAQRIRRIFGPRAKDVMPREVKTLRTDLEKILGGRESWRTPLLRELFGVLWDIRRRRRRSADHERLWFHLTGYCQRPGFGYPLDDWRIHQLWSIYEEGVQSTGEARVWAEWWTLWRRVAGGLDQAAQETLLNDIAFYLQPPGTGARKPPGPRKQAYDDMVRLAASLERIPAARKVELGTWLLERLKKKGESPQTWWALGRTAARVPLYGSAHNTVPRSIAAEWLEALFALDWRTVKPAALAATLLARTSGDRQRDLDATQRAEVIERLRATGSPASWMAMVRETITLDAADEQRVFGDTLPPGLRLLT
jgi:molecular chaperone DnaK (HSP70)